MTRRNEASTKRRFVVRRSRIGGARVRVTALAIFVAVTITGIAGAHGKSEKVLRWGLSGDPGSLWNATDFNGTNGAPIMSLINQGLVSFTPQNKIVPNLATSWKAVTPTKYVYTIRSGVRFSDGNLMTAKDIAYSIGVQKNPKTASDESNFFTNVKSVHAAGNKLTVVLSQPDALWQYIPAHEAGYVYERTSLSAHPSGYGTPNALPIGTGPYKVQEYVANSHVTLVRNPYYWGTKPYYDKIIFNFIPDPQTMFLAVRSGQLDGSFGVPGSAITTWRAQPNIHLTSFGADGFYGLTLDMDQTNPPFNNVHVRKAIAYAVDRAGINNAVYGNSATVANTLDDPATLTGILPAAEVKKAYAAIPSYSFDVAKAKAELAQSPVPNGFSTTLNTPAPCAACVAIAQALQGMLGKIGITLNLNMMPGPARFQYILAHGPNLGIQEIGNTADVPNPIELPWLYFKSDQATKGGNNSSNYRNASVDKIIDQGLATNNQVVAARAAIKAETAAAQVAAMVPIVWLHFVFATQGNLHLANPGPFFMNTLWINSLSRS
ncbi:MAG: ABC transporter substrate-binding protein [Gaiellaceae bacterium]